MISTSGGLLSVAAANVLRVVEDAGISRIRFNTLFNVIPVSLTAATYLHLLLK